MSDSCIVFTGKPRNAFGYGRKRIGGKIYATHRLAWAWANWNGEGDWKAIPEGMNVLHRCDNPPCVNPDHLFLGTLKDNTADMFRKGRANRRHGEAHRSARITLEQVAEIRAINKHGQGIELARKFGISKAQVSRIKNRKQWVAGNG